MIELREVRKVFPTRQGDVTALDGVSLSVGAGEFVAISGPSGCGKTTLLLTIGGMLRPSRGEVEVAQATLGDMSPSARTRFRAAHMGFVFQLFHLIPYLTVLENVILGGRVVDPGLERNRAMLLLDKLGLASRALHRPSQLSVGERQRVATARALIKEPQLILADEPTGNLDTESGREVCELLADYRRQGGTVVFVTHGELAGDFADRTVAMRAGRIVP